MIRLVSYIVPLLLSLWVLSACQREGALSTTSDGGERVTLSFSIDVPEYTSPREVLRGFGEKPLAGVEEHAIKNLELMVFNKSGLMVDYAVANVSPSPDGAGRYAFTVQLRPQHEKCVIHFIANRTLGVETVKPYIGRNEGDVLMANNLTLLNDVAGLKALQKWGRKEFLKIEADQNLGEIEMLHAMAKFEVDCSTPEAIGKLRDISYTICRTYDRGTVAPFNPDKLVNNPSNFVGAFAVDDRIATEPSGATYLTPEELGWYATDMPLYAFERHNKMVSDVVCIVIRAKYQGDADYTYYKLELINSENRLERYDVLRNYYYKLKIKDVLARGATTLEEALEKPAVNNLALSEELQVYPSYSDGKGRLEVEQSNFIVTDSQELTFQATYYPEGSTIPDNSKLRIIMVRNSFDQPAITGTDQVSIDNNGHITAHLVEPHPFTRHLSDIIVGVDGDPDLMRIVRVEVRKPYRYDSFEVNGVHAEDNQATVSFQMPQNSELSFQFVLPEDFNALRLPIELRFFTENFYPAANQTDVNVGSFSFGRKDGRTCYTTVLSKLPENRQYTCTFFSNRSDCAETIEVVSVENLFHTQRFTITN